MLGPRNSSSKRLWRVKLRWFVPCCCGMKAMRARRCIPWPQTLGLFINLSLVHFFVDVWLNLTGNLAVGWTFDEFWWEIEWNSQGVLQFLSIFCDFVWSCVAHFVMFHIPRVAKQLALSVSFFCHQEVRGLYGRTALQLGESSGPGPRNPRTWW